MKIVRFLRETNRSYGIVTDDDGIVDLGPRVGNVYPDVHDVIAAGALGELQDAAAGAAADFRLVDVTLLPPVRGGNAILVIGRNYGAAYEEMGTGFGGYPSIFQRRHSAQVGHGQNLVRPKVSPNYDCEVELAVVIGAAGRHVAEADAFGHVAGYAVFNEASVTDWMDHTSRNVTPGKNFEASGAFGPWMVTADEIDDPGNLMIEHRLNGEVLQQGSTAEMIFTIPKIINYLSTFTTLEPGDVIATGSPGGIRPRRKAEEFVKPGDVVEMTISGIGTLRNTVVDET